MPKTYNSQIQIINSIFILLLISVQLLASIDSKDLLRTVRKNLRTSIDTNLVQIQSKNNTASNKQGEGLLDDLENDVKSIANDALNDLKNFTDNAIKDAGKDLNKITNHLEKDVDDIKFIQLKNATLADQGDVLLKDLETDIKDIANNTLDNLKNMTDEVVNDADKDFDNISNSFKKEVTNITETVNDGLDNIISEDNTKPHQDKIENHSLANQGDKLLNSLESDVKEIANKTLDNLKNLTDFAVDDADKDFNNISTHLKKEVTDISETVDKDLDNIISNNNNDKPKNLPASDKNGCMQRLELLGYDSLSSLKNFVKNEINKYEKAENDDVFSSSFTPIIEEEHFPTECITVVVKPNLNFSEKKANPNTNNKFTNYLNDGINYYDQLTTCESNLNGKKVQDEIDNFAPLQGMFSSYAIQKAAFGKMLKGSRKEEIPVFVTDLDNKIVNSFNKMLLKDYRNYKEDPNENNNAPKIWDMDFNQITETPQFKNWINNFLAQEKKEGDNLSYSDLESKVLLVFDKIQKKFNKEKDQ